MLTKEINPMTVLFFTTKTSLAGLNKHVRVVARQLYAEAVQADLEVAGPIYWIYYGADGKPDTEFTLEIALPITEVNGYAGQLQTKQLPAFRCVSALHTQPWDKLSDTYGQLIGELFAHGHAMSGICREIYIHMDFHTPENNVTEVQIGLV
ncbi:MAG: GyrI-like domain-containing protein [Bacteroidota bacterium]